jgi:hypothetical protein
MNRLDVNFNLKRSKKVNMSTVFEKFVIPSAQSAASNFKVTLPGDFVQLDPKQVPDFVYNEKGVGYAMMFSPTKLSPGPFGPGAA